MPAYEIAFPVGTTSIIILDDDDEKYVMDIGTATFNRTGEDGAEIILALFHGDEFVGEVLEGQWKKGWDANINAAQAFTAIIDGSGTLEMEGEADAAGTFGYGWINSQLPLPLLDGLEITFCMEVPVDDTGAVVNRDIEMYFYLGAVQRTTIPYQDNCVYWVINVDESGLMLYLMQRIDGTTTTPWSGSDYSGAAKTTGDLEACIWRVVFHNGVAGDASPGDVRHMHVYLKQSDTLANAENATENELSSSPFDISDYHFNVGYPAYQIGSQNTTYYDSGNEAKTNYVKVDYPDFNVIFDVPDANLHLGEVELYDGNPDSGGIRVYDEDHVFANDPYIDNGLMRVIIDPDQTSGLRLDFYDTVAGSWKQATVESQGWLKDDSLTLRYPQLIGIQKVSSEEVTLEIRLTNTEGNNDYYLQGFVTLRRGQYFYTWNPRKTNPVQEIYHQLRQLTLRRFQYIGDEKFNDEDVTAGATNGVLSDNFGVSFDDEATMECILVGSANNKPDGATKNYAISGTERLCICDTVAIADIVAQLIMVGASPFALQENLFIEGENADLLNGATAVADGAASGGQACLMNANTERNRYSFIAETDLPEGRYIAVFRLRDTNQVASDCRMFVENITDAEFRNEEHNYVYKTLTSSYTFYFLVFDITPDDVSGTDTIYINVRKATAGANSIYNDYFAIIPIGDGESFPQEIAHNSLRSGTVVKRILAR